MNRMTETYHSLQTLYLEDGGDIQGQMIDTLEWNANTDRTDTAQPQKAYYTKSDARRRGQRTQYKGDWKGIVETPLGDIKNRKQQS